MDDTETRIQKSWTIRRELIDKIMQRGETLVASLKLVPETRDSITNNRWKEIVAQELELATRRFGNGEPLLSESELETLAFITNPCRGW